VKLSTLAIAVTLSLLISHATHSADGRDIASELGLREGATPVREMKSWRQPRKIVVLIDSESRLQWFRQVVTGIDGIQLVGARDPAEFLASAKDADAVEGLCNAAIVEADTQLRWIQAQGSGVEDCVRIPRVARGDILLTNMQRVDSANVAEHAFALMLALSRQLPAFSSLQQKRSWPSAVAPPMLDLQGGTLLVVGLGGNGSAIAERARAFGMRVTAVRAGSHAKPTFVDYVGAPSELATLLSSADVVVNTLPLTGQTEHLFDAAMFSRMKRTALFINIGRGKTVVTRDLVQALKKGAIAGAGLDVVDPEPLPADDPLWQAPNVIITPHVADRSALRMERVWLVMRENLRRYVRGEKLLSVVDPQRGY